MGTRCRGGGHLANVLVDQGYKVYASDIVDRGYDGTEIIDFLKLESNVLFSGDIITNPPYKYALEFVEKALDIVNEGNKVAMFLKLTFLEGQKRKQFLTNNPPKVYVYSKRQICAKNGEFEKISSSAVAYAWFVWEKGYKGDIIVNII